MEAQLDQSSLRNIKTFVRLTFSTWTHLEDFQTLQRIIGATTRKNSLLVTDYYKLSNLALKARPLVYPVKDRYSYLNVRGTINNFANDNGIVEILDRLSELKRFEKELKKRRLPMTLDLGDKEKNSQLRDPMYIIKAVNNGYFFHKEPEFAYLFENGDSLAASILETYWKVVWDRISPPMNLSCWIVEWAGDGKLSGLSLRHFPPVPEKWRIS